MNRKISSLALMFLSMALTLHLTDQAVRHTLETSPSANTAVAERQAGYADMWSLPKAGLGALVECEPDGIRLVSCLPGHAAAVSGLKVGDRIIAINGEAVHGCNEAWAVRQLRGKIGTKVLLDVERGEGIWQRSFRAEVERRNIDTQYSVYSRLKENELVVKVMWLDGRTAEQLAQHLSQVDIGEVDSVVLDLSNLSSGDVFALRECASLLLPVGTTVGHYNYLNVNGETSLNPLVTNGYQFTDRLTTVKVGPYTAKIGEVFARALADNLDIAVIGEDTAGLGTVDNRTIRSRAKRSVHGTELFDGHGNRIDGTPLKPDFWTWSNLLSPVAAGLE